MHRVFITGAAGYVGAMLCQKFSARDDVERVIALDKEPQPEMLKNIPKLLWLTGNTSDDSWQESVAEEKPDIVIHAAWQIREMYGKKALQWNWNIGGSDNVFNFVFDTPGVSRFVHFSTVASYAARPENTVEHHFTEEEPFRKSDYLYAEEKRIAEQHLEEIFKSATARGSNVKVAVIRPAAITGPRGRFQRVRFGLQSALSGQLKGGVYSIVSWLTAVVPVTEKWCRQFVHEDDITDIAELLAFSELKNQYDVFNACPPGDVVYGEDMAKAVGKHAVKISPQIIRFAFFWMWHLTRGKIPTSRGGWKSYSYPIAVDGSKITRMYGFQYRMGSKDAFIKNEGRYANG